MPVSALSQATLVVTVSDNLMPTFTLAAAYCVGAAPDALPTTSNNSITGTWSPAAISTATAGTATYTFTPDAGQCAIPATLVVTVSDNLMPTFTLAAAYCVGAAPDALPTTSNNSITGTWSPAAISTATAGTATYTFTPDAGQCATQATMEIVIVTPELTITKTAAEANYSSPGDILHYTIVVTNISILNLTDILVIDPHTGLSQTIASLAPNASETILTSYTVTQGDIDAGFVDNTASASYTCGGNTYDETATETVPAVQRPELTVNKDVNQTEISAPAPSHIPLQ